MSEILKNANLLKFDSEEGPYIKYEEKVKVAVYYDDIKSIRNKMLLYNKNIYNIAFWRIGFEKKEIWNLLKLKN
jgi:spore germination protein YaaH